MCSRIKRLTNLCILHMIYNVINNNKKFMKCLLHLFFQLIFPRRKIHSYFSNQTNKCKSFFLLSNFTLIVQLVMKNLCTLKINVLFDVDASICFRLPQTVVEVRLPFISTKLQLAHSPCFRKSQIYFFLSHLFLFYLATENNRLVSVQRRPVVTHSASRM